ncbi:PCLO protein, partial [Chloroceryle aenea]|nr:PCLO protein [Chloroceryle aenea]
GCPEGTLPARSRLPCKGMHGKSPFSRSSLPPLLRLLAPGKPPDPGPPSLSKSRTVDVLKTEQRAPGRSPSSISLRESKSRTDFKEDQKPSMMPSFLSEANPLSAVTSVVNKFNPFDLISDSDAAHEEAGRKQKVTPKDQGKPEDQRSLAKHPAQQLSPKPAVQQQGPVRHTPQQTESSKAVPQQQQPGEPKQQPDNAKMSSQAPPPTKLTSQQPGMVKQPSQQLARQGGPVKPPSQQAGPSKQPSQQPGPEKPSAQQTGPAKQPSQPGAGKAPPQQPGLVKQVPPQAGPTKSSQTAGPTKPPAQQPGVTKLPAQQPELEKP